MSKEIIRQIVSARFASFTGLNASRKSYPNQQDPKVPASGQWAKLKIEHVLRKVASIGSAPCTRRTGVIVIEVYERLDVGTRGVSELTDALEDWFSFYESGQLWTDAGRTVDMGENKEQAYYLSTVYVPFTYDD